MASEDTGRNKRLMEKYIELIWNAGEFERVEEFVTPDFVSHDPVMEDRQGPKGVVDQFKALHRDFRGIEFKIEDLVAEDDKVVAHWSARASFGPTSKPLELTGMSLARFADGRIAESWLERDSLALVGGVAPKMVVDLLARVGDLGAR
jgi:predicted SnoaL-like aldol condensation-catalyzing enzyme